MASKATAIANSQLEKAKEKVRAYEGTIAKANKNIDSAKSTVANLSKEYANNEKQIEKVKSQTEKYDNLISKTTAKAANYRKNLDDNKIKLRELETAQEASRRALEEAQKAGDKVTLNKLSKEYEKSTKEVEKAKAAVEKYTQSSKTLEQQSESYAKKLAAAKSKLQTLEKAQETNTKAVETARKVIVDYEKVISKNNEQLNKAKAKMREYSKTVADSNKRIAEAKKAGQEWGKATLSAMDNIIKRSLQVAGAITSVVGAFAIKAGFSEAMNLEGYKMQLETATKSTEKAGQLMSKAIKFANSTPFETGEVVEATAKMEAYGISSERWLKDVADMAGATNKSIDQATEAMADGVMGEFERLKEFGIKKEQLIEAAAKKYGKNVVFNKRGQIKDQIKLEAILQAEMQKKFAGGAEKQAKTLKGLWSTVTGVTKSSLAKIVGITEEGTIKQGSLFDKLKQHVEKVVNILNKWQEDGTIDKIAEKVTKAVGDMILFCQNLFEYIKRYRPLIETILVFVSTMYVATKAIAAVQKVIKGLTFVMGVLNGTIALNPMTWLAIGIATVIAGCYLLWKHLDVVISVFKGVFNWVKKTLDSFGPLSFAFALLAGPVGIVITVILGLIQHFDKLKKMVLGIPSALSELKKWLLDSYENFKKWIGGLSEAFFSLEGVKNTIEAVKGVGEVLTGWISSAIGTFQEFYGWIKNLLDGIGNFAFLLGGPIAPLLGLIQHFDKLKEVGEKAWGVIKKIFGAKDTDISITENKTTKDKMEAIQTLRANNPVGIGGVKLPELNLPKKSETNFSQDKKQTQTTVSAKEKTPPNVTVVLKGDFYGFKDFKAKVAEAVVKIANPNMSNMV
ncbi:MAG: hypothetical protein ACRDA0_10360 [Cetobacterium sp.]|uniref:hypothetical protein n=1 Tax=Cetobacterium sp. TaxID=2071632 RepID=UPI003F383884